MITGTGRRRRWSAETKAQIIAELFAGEGIGVGGGAPTRASTAAVGDTIGWLPYAVKFKEQHDPAELPPRIALADESRPIAELYVCIAVQSTTQAKYWNNPTGRYEIVRFLRATGYRVICIDQKPVHGTGLVWNAIPNGAEDESGDKPLIGRAHWLKHADFVAFTCSTVISRVHSNWRCVSL